MPAAADQITLPDWAVALCAVLAPWATNGDTLQQRIENGEVKPDDHLHYDLGISPAELAALVQDINEKVIDAKGTKHPPQYVSLVDLAKCKTIVDLMNLVFSRV